MKRIAPAGLLLVLAAVVAPGQVETVKVKIRAILVDRDLNQKPVPFLVVSLKREEGGAATEVKTGLDGTAQAQLPAGQYELSTPKPAELGGKRFSWSLKVAVAGTETQIDLTNDNAKAEEDGGGALRSAAAGDLNELFEKLKNSVVLVHAEAGDGSGFVVDPAGLVVTNNHVVESSNYVAVQFDKKRKVRAQVLATNAEKDVAVLWVNLAAFPEAVTAPILPPGAAANLAVGGRVFTIGNPFGREKVLTTGVISKVDKNAITSDININPGNSGGPLFTGNGQVAGITTAGLRLLASIVPIDYARPLIEDARKKAAVGNAPSAELLPVEPPDYFPPDALSPLLQQEKMDTRPYYFDAGEFHVIIITPPMNYFLRHAEEMAAARKAAKRAGGTGQAKPPASAIEDAQDYLAVVGVRVEPKYGALLRVRFKNGFQRMRLLCGDKELTPVEQRRTPFELHNQRGKTVDTTYAGYYSFLPDGVSPQCGSVVLQIFSEKEPDQPVTHTVGPETVARVWADLEPYRRAHSGAETKPQ
ncbi:MAG TPA: S1C family serine protease [Methylomirabilota bacterium]|nr:S1C family serine protease [Methylomirabilota bacterium]